ncbi:MAG: Secretion system C-terminal sorting domain, partial [Bacteroidota bacterium]
MLRKSLIILLLFVGFLGFHHSYGQLTVTEKIGCTPCEDYYGMGGCAPAAQSLVIADTIPGRFLLIHLEDPDTNTWFIEGDFYIDIHNYATVQSGDTAVFQFSQNGTYVINFQGIYGIPGGSQCYHYGSVTIEVTGLPMTAASEPVAPSPSPILKAFPNPTNGLLHVEWQDKASSKTTANLVGNNGMLIQKDLSFLNGKMELDLSRLPSGIYHLA